MPKSEKLTETITITERQDGFWLWDDTRGMNLSMKAKTRDLAFIEALGYYQSRLVNVETSYRVLKNQVDSFVDQFVSENEDQS